MMSTEIERRYLVPYNHWGWVLRHSTSHATILQAYLSVDPVVRLRLSEQEGKTSAFLTIKGPGTLERAEFEYPTSVEWARSMWPLAKYELRKVRHYVEMPEGVWEIDEFLGPLDGLWIAELEMGASDEVDPKHVWLGQEVTHDSRYSNAWLAQHQTLPITLL